MTEILNTNILRVSIDSEFVYIKYLDEQNVMTHVKLPIAKLLSVLVTLTANGTAPNTGDQK